MKNIFWFVVGLCMFVGVVYGLYWVVKTISYSLFYEDMVIETIKEQVNYKYLNK